MSGLLLHPELAREPLQASYSDEDNPVGLAGIEFIEYSTTRPQALGQVLQTMGFRPVARHRSREVLLYRQGGMNIVVNAHPRDGREPGAAAGSEAEAATEGAPVLAAIALRVRDAGAAHRAVLERGAWDLPTHPAAMELNMIVVMTT